MRLPFKITKNPRLPKIDRKLTLEHFFTFKNGHKIYSFQLEDLTKLSGRYLDQVKNTVNFMIQYNSGPDQVKKFCTEISKFAKDAIDNKMDRTEALIKVYNYAQEMPKLSDYVTDLENKMWQDLYVMFFVLDSEPELAFVPSQNAKKIEYLNTCTDEEKELFFCYLKNYLIRLSTIYRDDTLNSMIQEGKMIDLVDSLLNPTRMQSSLSKLPDMQESTLINSETSPLKQGMI